MGCAPSSPGRPPFIPSPRPCPRAAPPRSIGLLLPEFVQLLLEALLEQGGRLDQGREGPFPVGPLLQGEGGFEQGFEEAVAQRLIGLAGFHGDPPFGRRAALAGGGEASGTDRPRAPPTSIHPRPVRF